MSTMIPSEFVSSETNYRRARSEYGRVFRDESRLPAMVFQDSMAQFSFFEYSLCLGRAFPIGLYALSQEYQDETVSYMTIEPDPVSYYEMRLGYYGVASFAADSLADRFFPVMLRTDSADSFLARGDIGVYWGSSKKWGIYCDRESWDLCVLATANRMASCILDQFGVLDSTTVGNLLVSQNSHRLEVAKSFVLGLKKHYWQEKRDSRN